MYFIKYEPKEYRIFLKLSGFLTLEETQNYGKDMKDITNKLLYKPCLLIDATEQKIMTQENMEEVNRIREMLRSDFHKIAVVVSNKLHRRQVERTLEQVNVDWEERYFDTMKEASDWLDSFKKKVIWK